MSLSKRGLWHRKDLFKVQIFEVFFRSTPIGEELLHEFMMFSLGVPLSKKSLSSFLSTAECRLKKTLQGIPEFLEQTNCAQKEIEEANIPAATALVVARFETSTGSEQVIFTTVFSTGKLNSEAIIFRELCSLGDPSSLLPCKPLRIIDSLDLVQSSRRDQNKRSFLK